MNHSLSSRVSHPVFALLAFAALALAACAERPTPTQPTPQNPNRAITCGDQGCGGPGGGRGGSPPPPPPISISALSLPDNTVPIDGAVRTYTATFTNNTGAGLSGAVAQGYLVQGSTRRAAGGTQVNCNAGAGVLPNGTCQISFSVSASDVSTTSGSGTFLPGSATFELDLTAASLTAIRTVGVNLIPGDFDNFSLPQTLSLTGALGEFSVSIKNTGSQTIPSLSYYVTVIQGSARRSAGGVPMSCGTLTAGLGNLPPLVSCVVRIGLSLTNNNSGTGTLVSGPATLQVSLLQGTTVLNTKPWSITLVDGRFTSVTASPNPVRIGGGSLPFTATLLNAGASLPNVFVSATIQQGTSVLSVNHDGDINCGGGLNVLPVGPCTMSGTYRAFKSAIPPYALVPGPATIYFHLWLYNGVSRGSDLMDSIGVPITLVDLPIDLPTIGTVTPGGAAIIGSPGPLATYIATIDNRGPSIANATITARVKQGAPNNLDLKSGPAAVDCGAGLGIVPAGGCTVTGVYSANSTGVIPGLLVPGDATLEIELSDPLNGTLSTKQVRITLRSP